MKERYCFWSVATLAQARLLQSLVDSARAVGVYKHFHLWTDRPIEGAICHPLKPGSTDQPLFQLGLLSEEVAKLRYDYFIWLEADNYFVRPPGDLLRVLHGAPVHATLETDFAALPVTVPDWEGCSLRNHAVLMRFNGVHSRAVFNAGSGFWVVQRDAVPSFCELAWEYWEFCKKVGYTFGFEPLLAYVAQMLCGNPYLHTLRNNGDLWAADRNGCYSGLRPDGQSWKFVHDLSGDSLDVNPAIVQAPHSHVGAARQTQ